MSSVPPWFEHSLAYPLVLLALFASACGDSGTECACSSPDTYDAYFSGTWVLTEIIDGLDATARAPTAEEARTWHIFPSEVWSGDSVRAPATVEWAGRQGTGYWYILNDGVRVEVSLSRENGGSDIYVADSLVAVRGESATDTTLTLTDFSDPQRRSENYLRVGPP
jgi:hypothetical protein